MNHTHRDYRPYFKPVLCYLEGAWTLDKDFSEPFVSDRHAIEADSWFDLQEKIRFTSTTGDRLNSQNFAYLPTTIHNITEGIPTFAQWNYRILCHPLQGEVNVSHLVPVDDLGHRIANNLDFERFKNTRVPRFMVDEKFSDGRNRYYQWTEMDDWMGQIPGKDNYGAHMTDDAFGLTKLRLDQDTPMNVAYYHRRWKVGETDAMGDTVGHRGYSDRSLFVAENTQPRIAPTRATHCYRKPGHGRVCEKLEKRLSYAIPLELVFMTPLQTWNPYNIEYKGKYFTREAASVHMGGRNGGTNVAKAYNGTDSKSYFYTPVDFFSGSEVGHDAADTTKAATGVLDRQGNLRLMKSSGFRTLLPEIKDVGVLRTRYPLMPFFIEGLPAWKELEALRDVVMDMDGLRKFIRKHPSGLNTYNAMPLHHG